MLTIFSAPKLADTDAAKSQAKAARKWTFHPYPLACIPLAAVFAALYHEVAANIFRSWTTPDGGHGPLILLVSLYLIWVKRREIRHLPIAPAILPGTFLLASGCFALFAGQIGNTLLVQQISMVPVLLGSVLLLAGFPLFRILLLPIGYLLFLTGLLEQLLGSIGFYLQQATAFIAARLYNLFGFPVFLDQTLVELPHISLEVVRACSGISHIVALLALAVPLAYFTQNSALPRILLIILALFIGIMANGLRVFLIGIYALYNEGVDLHGPAETLYVSFIFFFGLALLVLISTVLRKKGKKSSPPDKPEDTRQDSFSPSENGGSKESTPRSRAVPCAMAIVLCVLTLGMVHLYTPQSVPPKLPLSLFPNSLAGYTGQELEDTSERIRPFSADAELMRLYQDKEGNSVELYIGYLQKQDMNRKIVHYRRAWMHEEARKLHIKEGNKAFRINKTQMRSQNKISDIYFWYNIEGKAITNRYKAKFLSFANGLLNRRTNASVIVASTSSEGTNVSSFLAEAVAATQECL